MTFKMLKFSEKKKALQVIPKHSLLITAMPFGINCIVKIYWSSCCSCGMELYHLRSISGRNLLWKTDFFVFSF